MGAFSDGLTATALALLTKYGQDGSFSREVEGAYNPQTGEMGASTFTTFSGKVQPDQFMANEVDGTIIKRTDTKLLVNKTDTKPLIGDVVTFGGEAYRVISNNSLIAQGADIIYILAVRK